MTNRFDGPSFDSLEARLFLAVNPVIGSLSASPNPVSHGTSLVLTANDVSDADNDLAKVQFYRDVNANGVLDVGSDTLLVEDTTSGDGWSYTGPTDDFPLGANTFLAQAVDAGGLYSQVVLANVTVRSAPPVIGSFVPDPASLARGAAITLTASDITDSDGTVSGVQFYRDSNGNGVLDVGSDTLLVEDTTSGDGWSYTGSTAGFTTGLNTFFARAGTNDGVYSLVVSTTATVTNVVPTVGSLTPSAATVTRGETLTLTAGTVADTDGTLAKVQFYRDVNANGTIESETDQLLGEDSSSAGGWTWSDGLDDLPSGEIVLLAQAVDNDGGVSAPASTNVTVNDVPVATADSYQMNEDATLNVDDATGVLANDTDANVGDTLTAIQVTVPSHAASFTLNADGSFDYQPAANWNGTDSFTYKVNDGTVDGNTVTVSIEVAAVNDAPVNTKPSAQNVNEDTDLVFNAANGNAISVADVDAASLQVTLAVTHGTLALSGVAGLTFTVGDGTGDASMTFTGAKADINTALEGLTFSPTANYNGAATLTITTEDLGSAGSGGAKSDVDTVTITVAAVNDDPTITSVEADPATLTRGDELTLTAGGVDDVDGSVESVQFYLDANGNGTVDENGDVLLGVDTDGSDGWSWTGVTDNFAHGDNGVLAQAVDNDGGISEVAAASVTVDPYSLSWSNPYVTVTAYDMTGPIDVAPEDILVHFGQGDVVISITLVGADALEGLGLVIDGASSVGRIVDARVGALGQLAFIASSGPIKSLSIGGGIAGYQLDGAELGGITFDDDLDGDGQDGDLTALYAGGVASRRWKIAGQLGGDVVASGGLRSLKTLASASDIDVVIGPGPAWGADLTFAGLDGVSIDSHMPIRSFVADNVADTDLTGGAAIGSIRVQQWSSGTITAPSVRRTLRVTGGDDLDGIFGADLRLTGGLAGGKMTKVMTNMDVTGAITGAQIRSAGSIGNISAGALLDSQILVGLQDDVTGLPIDSSDFVGLADNLLPQLGSLTIRGLGGVGSPAFSNSTVAAWKIGNVTLRDVLTGNAEDSFGLAAHTVKSYARYDGGTLAYSWSPSASHAWPSDNHGDFVFQVI